MATVAQVGHCYWIQMEFDLRSPELQPRLTLVILVLASRPKTTHRKTLYPPWTYPGHLSLGASWGSVTPDFRPSSCRSDCGISNLWYSFHHQRRVVRCAFVNCSGDRRLSRHHAATVSESDSVALLASFWCSWGLGPRGSYELVALDVMSNVS